MGMLRILITRQVCVLNQNKVELKKNSKPIYIKTVSFSCKTKISSQIFLFIFRIETIASSSDGERLLGYLCTANLYFPDLHVFKALKHGLYLHRI